MGSRAGGSFFWARVVLGHGRLGAFEFGSDLEGELRGYEYGNYPGDKSGSMFEEFGDAWEAGEQLGCVYLGDSTETSKIGEC